MYNKNIYCHYRMRRIMTINIVIVQKMYNNKYTFMCTMKCVLKHTL